MLYRWRNLDILLEVFSRKVVSSVPISKLGPIKMKDMKILRSILKSIYKICPVTWKAMDFSLYFG